ncbi:hypothetical protein EST38_g6669 [Candolleomyces aberdarensis]|uniref:Uncharacterized protein n=1 Tax=Candolleomyces aberdarensis TaxID=2316362 RepID=A0A4Q2DH38_9AGAR|nr:hypothetical protein EST38_g6669 [Candolleomyces aberdarensis]
MQRPLNIAAPVPKRRATMSEDIGFYTISIFWFLSLCVPASGYTSPFDVLRSFTSSRPLPYYLGTTLVAGHRARRSKQEREEAAITFRFGVKTILDMIVYYRRTGQDPAADRLSDSVRSMKAV